MPRRHGIAAVLVAAALLAAGCGARAAPAAGSSSASALKCSAGQPSLSAVPTGATQMGGSQSPVQLIHGHPLAAVFTAQAQFSSVGAQSPTWFTTGSGYTLILRAGAGMNGRELACATFDNATDNGWNVLYLTSPEPGGLYTLEMHAPTGTAQEACPGHRSEPNCATTPLSGAKGGVIGWWENPSGADGGDYAIVGGKQTGGVFSLFYQ